MNSVPPRYELSTSSPLSEQMDKIFQSYFDLNKKTFSPQIFIDMCFFLVQFLGIYACYSKKSQFVLFWVIFLTIRLFTGTIAAILSLNYSWNNRYTYALNMFPRFACGYCDPKGVNKIECSVYYMSLPINFFVTVRGNLI